MVAISGLEGRNSNASIEAREKKFIASKTSVRSEKSTEETQKRPKSSSASEEQASKKTLRVRSRTVEGNDLSKFPTPTSKITTKKMSIKSETNRSGATLKKKNNETEVADEKKSTTTMGSSQNENSSSEPKVENHNPVSKDMDEQRKESIQRKPSESSAFFSENNVKLSKVKNEMGNKKPSEIPKLKVILKENTGSPSKITTNQSRLPVKMSAKESELKSLELPISKEKAEPIKMAMKTCRVRKDTKLEEKVKEAMKDEFTNLVPLYETELKKITDVWVNTIYCSLTMRTNLVKLLFQAFPQINRSQFQMEDERILHCIAHAKNYTKSEADSLIQFIQTLIANREKTKEQYGSILANKEIAEIYNYDWRRLTRKIAELGEEAKQLQLEIPELEKRNEINEEAQKEKIRSMEAHLAGKEEELQKLVKQLDVLKQKESTYKGNVLLKVQDYKDIKADVLSMKSMEKEFEDLKTKFLYQNEMYVKKIKDLEDLLEDKKKILEKEKDVKRQLQIFLEQLQMQQQKLTMLVGKEQIEYGLGHRDKRQQRDLLWTAAIRLVLRGFLVQMKKLERDRNKMLLELQSNDSENFNTMATSIINKDNFIKSIKHQMNDFKKVCQQFNSYT